MGNEHQVIEAAEQCAFHEYGFLDLPEVKFLPTVRQICETCRHYNRSWACPPAIGDFAECKARAQQFNTMMIFSKTYEVEDSFDYEALEEGLADFRATVEKLNGLAKSFLPDFLLLSAEGCDVCEKCTYPDEPCLHPDRMFHSLEGYGFNVNKLAVKAGISYNNGYDVVSFFGGLLFNMDEE